MLPGGSFMRRSAFLVLFFTLPVLGIAFPALAYKDITPPEVKQKLDAEENVFILDVRQPEEYAQGYVPNAYLIPLGEIDQRLDEIPGDRPVIAVCKVGGRSALAAQQLDDLGFSDVSNMTGGTLGWAAMPAYLYIKGQDLWDQLANPDFFVLDVRKADEYAIEHIEVAVSVPLDQLGESLDEIPQDKKVIVIGKDDAEGAEAAGKLIESGYPDVVTLEGGMADWDLATSVSSRGKMVTTFAAIRTALIR
jgi:rhodanese-related sulfurtransferase